MTAHAVGGLVRRSPRAIAILRVLARRGVLGALRGRAHWPAPSAARATFEELGLVFIKFGQVLAVRRDFLPFYAVWPGSSLPTDSFRWRTVRFSKDDRRRGNLECFARELVVTRTKSGAEQGEPMYKVIMAPTEGADSERAAISVAVKLAQRFDADLRLVRVETTTRVIETIAQPPMLIPEQTVQAERLGSLQRLEALGTECRALGDIRVITALEDGPIQPALRDHAEEFNVDLIVMSSPRVGAVE